MTPLDLRSQILLLFRQFLPEERASVLLMLADEGQTIDEINERRAARAALIARADPDGEIRVAALRRFLMEQAGLRPDGSDPRPIVAAVSSDVCEILWEREPRLLGPDD